MSWRFVTAVSYSRAREIGDRPERGPNDGGRGKTESKCGEYQRPPITAKNVGRRCDGAPAGSNSRCEPPPSECIAVRVAARRRRCKKGGEFLAAARAVGPTRHWCVSVTPPRGSHHGPDAAPAPPPWNRCGRVAAPRNEIAARASTSRQALRTSSCFPVTPRIAVAPVVVVNRHSSSLPVNAPLRRRRHRREYDIRDHIRLSANEIRPTTIILFRFRRLNFARSPILYVWFFFFYAVFRRKVTIVCTYILCITLFCAFSAMRTRRWRPESRGTEKDISADSHWICCSPTRRFKIKRK